MDLVHVTGRPEPEYRKISKVGAGYIFRDKSDYRCGECIHFIADQARCFLLGKDDEVAASGYCIMWAVGPRTTPDDGDWDDKPQGCYKPSEVGYGTKAAGTLCRRCAHFDSQAKECEIVSGSINPGGCCDNQTPKATK